jgi:hypothetical protein
VAEFRKRFSPWWGLIFPWGLAAIAGVDVVTVGQLFAKRSKGPYLDYCVKVDSGCPQPTRRPTGLTACGYERAKQIFEDVRMLGAEALCDAAKHDKETCNCANLRKLPVPTDRSDQRAHCLR